MNKLALILIVSLMIIIAYHVSTVRAGWDEDMGGVIVCFEEALNDNGTEEQRIKKAHRCQADLYAAINYVENDKKEQAKRLEERKATSPFLWKYVLLMQDQSLREEELYILLSKQAKDLDIAVKYNKHYEEYIHQIEKDQANLCRADQGSQSSYSPILPYFPAPDPMGNWAEKQEQRGYEQGMYNRFWQDLEVDRTKGW